MEKTSGIKTNLSAYDNSWYRPGSFPKRTAWFILGRLFINTYLPWPMVVKKLILTIFGAKIGANVVLKPKINIKYPWMLSVDNDVWIGENVWIDNLAMVTIGTNSSLSQGAMLLTGNHDYTSSKFDLIVKPIVLEEGTWLGAQSIVCPGVTCYSHATLSVGSVATKNLEPYSIYQGNPAVRIKTREMKC
jgi:putative colanic acid biosynthesis acetyltransferase WcaF